MKYHDKKAIYDLVDTLWPNDGNVKNVIYNVVDNSVTIINNDNSQTVINLAEVVAGDGMDFVTNEPVTLGTPSTIDSTTINEVTETSHTHELGDISSEIQQQLPFLKTGWQPDAWKIVTISNVGREITLTPVSVSYNYWIQGVQYVKSAAESVTISDTTGLWFIYYDGETLTASTNAWSILEDNKAFISVFYWNATQQKAILKGWEFHTFGMGPAEHNLIHTTIGTRYGGGLAVSANGTDVWKINVTEGTIIDEDIYAFINASTEPYRQVLAALEAPKLYRTGAGIWNEENAVPTNIVSLNGSNEVYVNTVSGGTWSLVPTTLAKYSAMWLIAFTDWDNPLKWIIGQEPGDTLQDALDNNTLSTLNTSGLPGPEFRVIARVIVKNTNTAPYYAIELIDEMQNDDIIAGGGGSSTDSYVTGVSFDSGTRNITLVRNNGLADLTANIPTGNTDEKVKYDSADPTAGYLSDKIVAGTGISIEEGTGANENKLKITNSATQYTLPIATPTVLGGIKLGTGLNIDVNGVVSVNTTFLNLDDVVDETYIGKAWNIPKVTDTEDGLELTETEELELIDAKFTELLDCPSSYAGYEGYLVRVKLDGTGLEFVAP